MSNTDTLIVAHRGLARYAPENTSASYTAALALGFGLEIDLNLTADREIVIIHDWRLDRTTNGEGPAAERSKAEIQTLDAGSWSHPSYGDQRVPTLAETLALVKERRRASVPTLICLDLKAFDHPMETEICKLVEAYELVEQVLGIGETIHSPIVRQRFKESNPHFPTAVFINGSEDWDKGLADATADWLYIRFIPTEEQTVAAHAAGKRIFKAGPLSNGIEPENWRRLRDVGVDAILSDYPLKCRDALSK